MLFADTNNSHTFNIFNILNCIEFKIFATFGSGICIMRKAILEIELNMV